MNLDLHTILWSTRGYDWGCRFPLQPQKYNQYCEDWLENYEKMFYQSYNKDIQVNSGCIEIDKNPIQYIAIKFADPEDRKDISGRPILHEVAILGNENKDLQNTTPIELRNIVWNKLSAVYHNIYRISYQELSEKQIVIKNEMLEIIIKALPDTEQQPQKEELNPNFTIAITIIVGMVIAIALTLTIILNQKSTVSPSQTTKENQSLIQTTSKEVTVAKEFTNQPNH
jgi:hypothetical protein